MKESLLHISKSADYNVMPNREKKIFLKILLLSLVRIKMNILLGMPQVEPQLERVFS